MSKRHYNIEQGGWNPLTDPTLIFYAPMSNGDLTDHISGNSLTMVNQSKVTWDSNVGMYRVQKETKANEMYWSVNLRYDATTNPYGCQATSAQNYTMYCWGKRLSTSYYNYPMFFIIGSYRSNTTFNPSCMSMRQENSTAREMIQAHITRKSDTVGNFMTYHNDTLDKFYDENLASNTRHYCNNWVTDNWERVGLNPYRDGNDSSIQIYVSNIMIFSRALTDDEIIFLSTNFTDWL